MLVYPPVMGWEEETLEKSAPMREEYFITVPCLELLEHEIIKSKQSFHQFYYCFLSSLHSRTQIHCLLPERVAPIASLSPGESHWFTYTHSETQSNVVSTAQSCLDTTRLSNHTAANQPLVCWLTKTQPGSLPGQTQ